MDPCAMEPGNYTSMILVEVITNPEDLAQGFKNCAVETFIRQIHDGMFTAGHPGWDTPDGLQKCTDRYVDRWRKATRNKDGDLNTIFLKATILGNNEVAGFAIWVQQSMIEGHGDRPVEDLSKAMDLDALYPGNKNEQRYMCQMDAALHQRRIQVVKEKANSSPPSAFSLDMCCVNPAFQKRGIAGKLVQWGLDEAKRRGGL